MQNKCPSCKKKIKKEKNKYFPFCSQRCRLADLNKWFNEDYAISEEPQGKVNNG
jgi:endogenous inhibitor of DNA gyrase (YacG/DUF329 family)